MLRLKRLLISALSVLSAGFILAACPSASLAQTMSGMGGTAAPNPAAGLGNLSTSDANAVADADRAAHLAASGVQCDGTDPTCVATTGIAAGCDAPAPHCEAPPGMDTFYEDTTGTGTAAPTLGGGVGNDDGPNCFKGIPAQSPTDKHDVGVAGVQPADCMPHKSTANLSPIMMNHGWLYKEPVPVIAGVARWTIGWANPLAKNSQNEDIGKSSPVNNLGGTSEVLGSKACKGLFYCTGLGANSAPPQPREVWNRLQEDACANQFIMDGLENFLQSKNLFDPIGKVGFYDENYCQPLNLKLNDCLKDDTGVSCIRKTNGKDKYDYEAWYYAAHAWRWVRDDHYYGANGPCVGNDTGCEGDKGWMKFGDGILPPDNVTPMGPGTATMLNERGNQIPIYNAGPTGGTLDFQINDLLGGPTGGDSFKHERIVDPSHPYSPRWDYLYTDRSLSHMTGCGGWHEYGACTVRCASVPVDIMRFREPRFRKCFDCRWAVNMRAFTDEVNATMAAAAACVPPVTGIAGGAYTNAIQASEGHPNPVPFSCATPTGNVISPNTVTGLALAGQWPPCSTKFDKGDNRPDMCNTACQPGAPGTTGACPAPSSHITPQGSGGLPGLPNDAFEHSCEFLAAPVTPLNVVKLRDSTKLTGDQVNQPEGYKFSDFFINKPYMRWWDTGNESSVSGTKVDLYCDAGAHDTIIGVGSTQNNCRYGGWGSKRSVSCNAAPGGIPGTAAIPAAAGGSLSIPAADAIGGWEELKLYQLNSDLRFHLICLAQNEKTFKQFGAEDMILKGLGVNKPAHDAQNNKTEEDYPGSSWRGYISAPNDDQRFPNLFHTGAKGAVMTGLDNAQQGDIIYLDQKYQDGTAGNGSNLPVLAVVLGVHTHSKVPTMGATEGEWVRVADFNYGKYPDACGNTNSLGIGPQRYIYKVDRMPYDVYEQVYYSKTDPANCPAVQLSDDQGVYFDPASMDPADTDTQCLLQPKGSTSLFYNAEGFSFLCGDDVNMQHCQTPDPKVDTNYNVGDQWGNYKVWRLCQENGFKDCTGTAPGNIPALPAR